MLEKNGLTIFTNSQPHKLFKRITQKILMNNPNYHIPNKNSGSGGQFSFLTFLTYAIRFYSTIFCIFVLR